MEAFPSAQLRFEQHNVSGLMSIAHLLPRSKGRTGIYVLGFADDQRYVGQAVDAVGRFATHRRRWHDIVTVDFCRVPGFRLDQVERDLIDEHRHRGLTLRNVTYALGNPTAPSDLDWSVERSDQLAWLTGDAWLDDVEDRTSDPAQRLAKHANYERLAARPDFRLLQDTLRTYVQLCVPRPRATELTFWALSATPATNRTWWPRLAAVSINKMETLVIGHHKGDVDRLWAFVNVSRRTLIERLGSLSTVATRFGVEFQERDYEAAGGDVVGLVFPHARAILDGFSATGSQLVPAARELNLRLMRKGPTFQWRGHCFDLADHVV